VVFTDLLKSEQKGIAAGAIVNNLNGVQSFENCRFG
jgi:hypothetical protein